jgi:hypothetical protein
VLYTYLHHSARYYLKSWLSLSLSKISYFLCGTPSSSLCSQKPATGPCPELAESSSCQRISPGPRRFEKFRNNINFYGEELLAPRPTPKLEGHPLSAVSDCLLNIFAVTLRIRRPSLCPQPEDAPLSGEKNTSNMDACNNSSQNVTVAVRTCSVLLCYFIGMSCFFSY